jgi:preprotein translocase subunit SecB
MSENGMPVANDSGAAAQPQAALVMNLQYVKDLSFEVPGAPEIFTSLRSQPSIGLNLDVQVRKLNDQQPVYEVTLAIKTEATEPKAEGGDANEAGRSVFIAELAYCGIVTLNGVSDANVEPMLLIEVPRLLFPYARNILADVTRDGGFPPVLLQPIDFVALWQQRRAAASQPVGHA